MEIIDAASNILLGLIIACAGLRGIYLAVKIIIDPDNKDVYLKKLKTTMMATIVGISVFGIKSFAEYYFR